VQFFKKGKKLMNIKSKSFPGFLNMAGLLTIMILSAFCSPSVAAERAISIGGSGLAGPDLTASVIYVEYEQTIINKLSFYARGGQLSYDYDDDEYEEEGDGPGIEGGVRFYPSGDGLKGFFIGAGLGLWDTEWDWIDDKGTAWETRGSDDSTSVELHFIVGGRLGSKVQFVPTFQIGSFLSTDAELGAYAVLGASISFGL